MCLVMRPIQPLIINPLISLPLGAIKYSDERPLMEQHRGRIDRSCAFDRAIGEVQGVIYRQKLLTGCRDQLTPNSFVCEA